MIYKINELGQVNSVETDKNSVSASLTTIELDSYSFMEYLKEHPNNTVNVSKEVPTIDSKKGAIK